MVAHTWTTHPDNLRRLLFSSFAVVSLFLVTLGIYGVTAYSVAQRRFEFGLRLAIGAQRRQLLSMVLSEVLRLAFAGVVLGTIASLAMTKVLGSVVGELPAYARTYTAAVLALLGLAATAALMPAHQAAAAEAIEVLRYE